MPLGNLLNYEGDNELSNDGIHLGINYSVLNEMKQNE
jgi:hypothetical protein